MLNGVDAGGRGEYRSGVHIHKGRFQTPGASVRGDFIIFRRRRIAHRSPETASVSGGWVGYESVCRRKAGAGNAVQIPAQAGMTVKSRHSGGGAGARWGDGTLPVSAAAAWSAAVAVPPGVRMVSGGGQAIGWGELASGFGFPIRWFQVVFSPTVGGFALCFYPALVFRPRTWR